MELKLDRRLESKKELNSESSKQETLVCWTCFSNTKRLEHDCKHLRSLNGTEKIPNNVIYLFGAKNQPNSAKNHIS